jgi:hypothetical protein
MSGKCFEKWQRMYEELKYAKENPNSQYRIGYSKLGTWLSNQRLKYREGKLSITEIKLLEDLGIDLNYTPKEKEKTATWDEGIVYLEDYYMENGNIGFTNTYVTEDGFKLGKWLNTQRIKNSEGRLSLEKCNTLNSMYMIWSVRDNNVELKEFCNKYGISYSLNKTRMSKLPISRLEFMINYLIDREVSYIDGNGYLLDIIFVPYIENMLNANYEDDYSYMLKR